MDMLRQGFDDVMGMCKSGEYDVRNMLQYGHNYGSLQLNHSLATFLAKEVSLMGAVVVLIVSILNCRE